MVWRYSDSLAQFFIEDPSATPLTTDYVSIVFIGLLFSIYIILLIRRSVNTLESVSLSFILGGAIGNGIDRVYNNYVIDFIDIYYWQYHWPAFNFADSFISIGAVGFFIRIILHK